jgi:hypothetical protein
MAQPVNPNTSNYYQFPPPGDEYENEIPVWMTFYAKNWTTFNSGRTRDSIKLTPGLVISIPYPRQMNTSNSQTYTAGGSLNVQSVETGNLLGTLGQQIAATKELASSFFSGGSIIRFDHFETILEPGARRTHSFEINMVAKNEKQAKIANTIALIFQNNCFPIANTASLLTMKHPYIWCFEATSTNKSNFVPDYWDGQPLPSVLKQVDINRSPILNTPFTTPNYRPIALNIKLLFVELEPAMQSGIGNVSGTLSLMNRAERFISGMGRKEPPRGEWE